MKINIRTNVPSTKLRTFIPRHGAAYVQSTKLCTFIHS